MRPTLQRVFAFSLIALLFGLGLIFYQVMKGWEQTLLQSSERERDMIGREVARRVSIYLEQAPAAIHRFDQQVKYGLVDPRQISSVEQGLLSLLLADQKLSEATLTYATPKGKDANGSFILNPATSGQVAVLRSATDGEFVCKRTWFTGKGFVSQMAALNRAADPTPRPGSAPIPSLDPTEHPTFQTAANRFYGQTISTDLHWSQIDALLPEARRRVELSVQKTIEDSAGHFAGVLRVGLFKSEIDGAVREPVTGVMMNDPHLIFICDTQGRLITGWGDRNRVTTLGDDLRIAPADVPPAVAEALRQPALKSVDETTTGAGTSFRSGKEPYLATFRYLPNTQDWIVGIVVPRDYYLGALLQIRSRVLLGSLGLAAVIFLAGMLITRGVVKSHSLILKEMERMKEFEFAPSRNSSFLGDVQDVLAGLERAKTALRAMSKYVPVDLVRQLYQKGVEPELGGTSAEISVMFTDIKGFTAFSETMTTDRLADLLGRYLQVMAEVIHDEKGTIDKFIGDAVMAFWNAPETVDGHELLACRAALRCAEALNQLFSSPEWGATPRFETRIGLSRCTASVGHFGAPNRLNYTAIGDGVNLASRLEGLNKYYGTQIIVSEQVYVRARDAFNFRKLDHVAVKGKSEHIVIYELIGVRGPEMNPPAFVGLYERALDLFERGEFAAALSLLESNSGDAPSGDLAARCRECVANPPKNWTGIRVFETK